MAHKTNGSSKPSLDSKTWIAVGLGFGLMFGMLMKNLAIGMATGLMFGIALASIRQKSSGK